MIVEGKMCTTVGEKYINLADKNIDYKNRSIVKINLSTDKFTGILRIMQREGISLEGIASMTDKCLNEYCIQLKKRTEHDTGMRAKSKFERSESDQAVILNIDTSKYIPQEIATRIVGNAEFLETPAEWEIESIDKMMSKFKRLGQYYNLRYDKEHFDRSLSDMEYLFNRLKLNANYQGLVEARYDLQNVIIEAAYALMMKQVPRFFIDKNGDLSIDTESHKWSPEYYKIANAWPTLKRYLTNKDIMDPFAGAGSLMNVLAARSIPRSIILGDIAYGRMGRSEKHSINGLGKYYQPVYNSVISRFLFDSLPSWYKPDFSKIKGYIAADAGKLPIKDDVVDYIVGDPPYGVNLNEGGIDKFVGFLPELKRVSREGILVMVPEKWTQPLSEEGKKYDFLSNNIDPSTGETIQFKKLTGDLSQGKSSVPVCYILINSKK